MERARGSTGERTEWRTLAIRASTRVKGHITKSNGAHKEFSTSLMNFCVARYDSRKKTNICHAVKVSIIMLLFLFLNVVYQPFYFKMLKSFFSLLNIHHLCYKKPN